MNPRLSLSVVVFAGALLESACGASSQTGPAAQLPPASPNPGETSAIAQPTAAPSTGVQPAATPAGAATSVTSPKSPPIDEGAVVSATGGKPENTDGVVKVSFPRTDVPVEVDGSKLAPFLGLTSWAAFTPGILFLHYWGRGKAAELAATVKTAVDLTAWDGKAKAT